MTPISPSATSRGLNLARLVQMSRGECAAALPARLGKGYDVHSLGQQLIRIDPGNYTLILVLRPDYRLEPDEVCSIPA